MPKAHRLIANAAFNPDEVRALRRLFDDVWASLAREIGDDPHQVEAARMRLATIVIDLAKLRSLDDLELTHTAARLMRETSSARPASLQTK
jgi:hypothetical protein